MRNSSDKAKSSKKRTASQEQDLEDSESRRRRGSYKCSKCGQPKKGHVCLELPQPSSPTPTPTEGSTPIPTGFHPPPFEFMPPYGATPLTGEPNTIGHLMNIIAQLESQVKLLSRENTQLRNQLKWYEYNNMEENQSQNVAQFNSPTEIKSDMKEDTNNTENTTFPNNMPLDGLTGISALSGLSTIQTLQNVIPNPAPIPATGAIPGGYENTNSNAVAPEVQGTENATATNNEQQQQQQQQLQ